MSRIRLLVAALALLLTAMTVVSAAPGEAGGGGKKVAIYDLFGQKLVKPETIFLTANSGPYLDELVWTGWRSGRAVAHGVYVSDCASCPPPERREAKVALMKLKPCPKKGGSAYKIGRMTTGADYSGEPKTVRIPTGYDFCHPRRR